MSRHLDNLKRLCVKLQRHFGEDDAFFLQVKRELESREALEPTKPKYQDCSIPYSRFIQGERASAGCAHHSMQHDPAGQGTFARPCRRRA